MITQLGKLNITDHLIVSGTITAPSGIFAQSLTVSGVPVQIGNIDEVEPAIIGTNGITVTSGSSTTTLTGFYSEFTSASGSLQNQINSITFPDTTDALVGVDGITIISGTNTTTVSGFRNEFVSASGYLNDTKTGRTTDEGPSGAWTFQQGIDVNVTTTGANHQFSQFGPPPLLFTALDSTDTALITFRKTTNTNSRALTGILDIDTGSTSISTGGFSLNGFAYTVTGTSSNLTNAAVGGLVGGRYAARHQGTGIVSLGGGVSVQNQLTTTGTFTVAYGFQNEVWTNTGGGTINTAIGFRSRANAAVSNDFYHFWGEGATSLLPSTTITISGINVYLEDGITKTVAISGSHTTTSGIGIAGNLVATRGYFSDSLTISGIPVQINGIDEIEPALIGVDGITIISGTNTTTVSGFRSEFLAASGSLQSQLSTVGGSYTHIQSTPSTEWVINHSLGSGSVLWALYDHTDVAFIPNSVVISGTNTVRIFMAPARSGKAIISMGGGLQGPIGPEGSMKAILGSDGITVISGASTVSLTGFRTEFVAASGSLQSQINAIDNSVTLQDAYDNGTGIITAAAGKPVVVTGTGAGAGRLVAVTGTFLQGITVGSSSTYIYPDEIRIGGDRVVVEPQLVAVSGYLITQINNGGGGEPAIIGTNGITVTSGSSTTTLTGFYSEFVAASGTVKPKAIIGSTNVTVVSGANTITIGTPSSLTITDLAVDNISSGGALTIDAEGTLSLVADIVQVNADTSFETLGPLRLPDGAASAPALTFTNDTNTGVWRRGNEILSFAAGGTERVAISGANGTTSGIGVAGNVTANEGHFSNGVTVSGAPVKVEKFMRKVYNVAVSGTAAPVDLMNFTIPANSMGPNSELRFEFHGTYYNNSGTVRNHTIGITFGNSLAIYDTSSNFGASAFVRPHRIQGVIANLGSQNSQFISGDTFLNTAGAAVSGTLDLWTTWAHSQNFSSPGTISQNTATDLQFRVSFQHSAATGTLDYNLRYGKIWVE